MTSGYPPYLKAEAVGRGVRVDGYEIEVRAQAGQQQGEATWSSGRVASDGVGMVVAYGGPALEAGRG